MTRQFEPLGLGPLHPPSACEHSINTEIDWCSECAKARAERKPTAVQRLLRILRESVKVLPPEVSQIDYLRAHRSLLEIDEERFVEIMRNRLAANLELSEQHKERLRQLADRIEGDLAW